MTTHGDDPLRRVHILGSSGSGKTTLAIRLARILGTPVHHLDEIAREGGGSGPLRTEHERSQAIAEIVATTGWVTEGIHLGWTDELLTRAQRIVWLDHTPPAVAQRRILGRFLRDAAAEARRRRGRERYLRVRDYGKHISGLVAHLKMVGSADPVEGSMPEPGQSRAATAAALGPHWDKVIHCARPGDVDAFIGRISGDVPTESRNVSTGS